jgi:hypothetical protein
MGQARQGTTAAREIHRGAFAKIATARPKSGKTLLKRHSFPLFLIGAAMLGYVVIVWQIL